MDSSARVRLNFCDARTCRARLDDSNQSHLSGFSRHGVAMSVSGWIM